MEEVKNIILLIEDSEDDVMFTHWALEKAAEPMETIVAGDGETGINLVKTRGEQLFCVLLDMNLPIMDGGEVLHAIRSFYAKKQLPVYILAGSKSEIEYWESKLSGVNGYLMKPLTSEDWKLKVLSGLT